jgi:hypothetical protein
MSRTHLRAGHQVVDINGCLPTSTLSGSGPAGHTAAIAIRLTSGKPALTIVRTFTIDETLRYWGAQGMVLAPGCGALRQLAKGQEPAATRALGSRDIQFIDEADCMGILRPRLMASWQQAVIPQSVKWRLTCRLDVFCVDSDFDATIATWQREVIAYVLRFRKAGCKPDPTLRRPRPLSLSLEKHLQPQFHGVILDMRGPIPLIVSHKPPLHKLTFDLKSELLEGFDDTIMLKNVMRIGVVAGSRRCRMNVTLWPNHASALAEHARLSDDLKIELDAGCKLRFGLDLPFIPFVGNPNGMVDKAPSVPGAKPKVRQIEDASASLDGESVNDWIFLCQTYGLQLVAIDDIADIYARLLPFALALKLPILLFSTDMSRAYRSVPSAFTCWWHNGSHQIDSNGRFRWLVDTCLSFGNSKNPLAFSRIARALRWIWSAANARDMCKTRTFLSTIFQKMMDDQDFPKLPGLKPIGFTRATRFPHKHYREYNGLVDAISVASAPPPAPIKSCGPLSMAGSSAAPIPTECPKVACTPQSPEPVDQFAAFRRVCTKAMSPAPTEVCAACLHGEVAYLDDGLGAGVGEEISKISHANNIATVTSAGFDSNEAKNAKGAPALTATFVGFVIDATIVDRPTISITPIKMLETTTLLDEFVTSLDTSPLTTVTKLRSLIGKLLRASLVVRRGRLFVCGILANLRLANSVTVRPRGSDTVRVTRWCQRNIKWWQRLFLLVPEPLDMLLPKVTVRHPCQGDASGLGFGGLIIVDDTIYYFFGAGTAREKAFLADHTLNVNLTEALTQCWMLELFAEHLAGHVVNLECDNLVSVTLLHEHRSRTLAASLILERIELIAARNRTDPQFSHIAGVINRLSDELSRKGDTFKFRTETTTAYPNARRFCDVSSHLSQDQRCTAWLSEASSTNAHSQ